MVSRSRRRLAPPAAEPVEGRCLPAPVSFLSIADPPPVVRPATGDAVERFTVTLDPVNIEQSVTVHYRTVDGTATAAGHDYVPAEGTLLFEFGRSTAYVDVTIPARTAAEPDKTFGVVLSDPNPYWSVEIARGSATATILGHPAGRVGFGAPAYQADAAAGSATVDVRRVNVDPDDAGIPLGSGVTVGFKTVAGTAVPGVDYRDVSGTLTFGYGAAVATFDVPLLVNPYATGDRTVNLVLSDPSGGATLDPAAATAVLTIHPANPLVVTNTRDSGLGSLRQAILTADSIPGPGPVTITFAIPGAAPHTIRPGSPLPALTRPVTIDALTQPGYRGTPVVSLDGSALAGGGGAFPANGLFVAPTAGGSVVRGLAIGRFPGYGIVLQGGGGSVIERDDLGTDPAGRLAAGNGIGGVLVANSAGNRIGGTGPGEGNVLSANGLAGVWVTGGGSRGNLILGNRIGTDASGAAPLGNGQAGVLITEAPGNVVGGAGPGAGNVISGNGTAGVLIGGAGATGNALLGNKVGTDLGGRYAVPNAFDGLFIFAAPGNVVGGLAPGAGNVFSGNGSVGVQVLGPGASGNVLLGNTIGADVGGRYAVPNARDGLFLNNAPRNQIGGPGPGAGNLISGNGSVGVQVFGAGAAGNRILGNRVGTDRAGLAAVPNARDGVFLNGAPGTVVGTGPADGNLISGNGSVGLQVYGPGASNETVVGNRIGVDAAGAPRLGNAYGLFVNGAPGLGRGGRSPSALNVIRGNRVAQVFQVTGSVAPAARPPGRGR